jgi:uncharacterized tellurite resistance protein B-like protein
VLDELMAWLAEGRHREGAAARRSAKAELAAAALLFEAAHVDDTVAAQERQLIGRLLERRFGLDHEAARCLLVEAERTADRSTQLFRFAQLINDAFSPQQKIELMEMLWEVVYADGSLDALEDTLLRRIGGLLYIPDHERGAARQRVLERAGKA